MAEFIAYLEQTMRPRQSEEDEQIQALIDKYEDQDRLALNENLNQKMEWN